MPRVARQPKGRPSIYTIDTANEICKRLASGETLRAICRDDAMPEESTVRMWALADYKGFYAQYARAREIQAEGYVDEIMDISDDGTNDWVERQQGKETILVVDHEHIQRSRLRVDSRKWFASKVLPKKYGERVIQEVTGADGGPIQTEDVNAARELFTRRVAGIASRVGKGNGASKPH